MRGLTILVAGSDPTRFHAALSLAAAQAALGARARLHLQGKAVALLRLPARDDPTAAGLPSLIELRTEAVALGVELTACQSGLALADVGFADLPEGIQASGLIELLTDLGEDRLLVF